MVHAALFVPRAAQGLGVLRRRSAWSPRAFRGRYLFVYPFVKTRAWYALPADERWRIMQDHIRVGREYPQVDNHTTYSFGLDDQEFVVAFDTDDASAFLDLVQRLRTTEASAYTLRDTPSFTCIATSVERALSAVDGEPVPATALRSALAMTHPDFDEVRDITVIGAGPVGLSAAFWAGMREASSRIIDSLPELGGQLTTLYPEKWIFDVPGHPKILAKDLVELHRQQTLEQFDVPVHLETTAESISWEDDLVVLHTDKGDLRSRTVIVAGGHGAFEPKKLPDYDMTAVGGPRRALPRRLQERVRGQARGHHRRRRQRLRLGRQPARHRRARRRSCTAARASAPTRRRSRRSWTPTPRAASTCTCPTRCATSSGNGAVEGVQLFHSEDPDQVVDVPCDAILLQLGFKTALGPLKEWGFEIEKGAICVDGLFRTSLERVWACGDITTFDGKLKLIATGYAEAAIAVSQAVHHIRPEMKIQPKYSTNTGVPGAVEGQA